MPLLHIDYRIGENERAMVQHMGDTVEELAKAAGVELVNYTRGDPDGNGSAIHEHGTCRMGDDPKRSALNKFNQMHEVKNVFVVDGSAFTTRQRKEPDDHHPRSRLARDGLSCGRDEEGEPLT